MKKRVFSLLLAIVLLAGVLPGVSVEAEAISDTDITAKLDQLRNQFPSDTYWNHVAGQSYDGNSVTYSPCGTNGHTCNEMYGGKQCYAYARHIAKLLFGSWPVNVQSGTTGYVDANGWTCIRDASQVTLQPGDYVRADGHSAIVWKVEGETVYVTQCWGSASSGCKINWGAFWGDSKSTTKAEIVSKSFEGVWKRPGSVSSSHNPQGCVDEITGGNGKVYIRGWTFDRDELSKNLEIHVYIGGPAGSGEGHGGIIANQGRPDVNAAYPGVGDNHGFAEWITTEKRGTQEVYVYGINTGGGTNVELGRGTVTIGEPQEFYPLDVNSYIDGNHIWDAIGYGTFDVYINGEKVANDVNDWCQAYPAGTNFVVNDIKAVSGYVNRSQSSYSGTIEGDADVHVDLVFETQKNTDTSTQQSSDYLSQCTFRRSCLTVEITNKTTMKSLPCSKGTNAASTDVRTMNVGDELKVTGLYKNTAGNWWYKVSYGKSTGYVYAGDTKLLHYDFGTTITGASAPSALSVGQRFSIKGTITDELTDLKQVGATIKSNGKTVMQFYENTTDPYDLLNSKIDYAMRFNELPEGWYEYQVYVGEGNCYSDGEKVYEDTRWPAIYARKFKVGNPPAPAGIDVYWCGRKVTFDQQPVIIGGRTMVPVRAIFEAMGINVDWNATQKKVTASRHGVTVELTVDNTAIKTFMGGILSNSKIMDAAAKIIGGRTLIPARYAAEAFGYTVNWDADTRTVYIEEK